VTDRLHCCYLFSRDLPSTKQQLLSTIVLAGIEDNLPFGYGRNECLDIMSLTLPVLDSATSFLFLLSSAGIIVIACAAGNSVQSLSAKAILFSRVRISRP
jgi:hypothetical protein